MAIERMESGTAVPDSEAAVASERTGHGWIEDVHGRRMGVWSEPGAVILGCGLHDLIIPVDAMDDAIKRLMAAGTAAQAAAEDDAGEREIPELEVMKLVRKAFFTGNPDASEDDWRRYCTLIGPEVAEKYGDWPLDADEPRTTVPAETAREADRG